MPEKPHRPFSELLEELISLYKQLRKENNFKESNIEITGDVDFLLTHFDSIKSSIDNNTFEHLGEPVRDLLESLLIELKKEVKNTPTSSETNIKEQKKTQKSELEIIDEKLKKRDLSTAEINILLDKRATIQNNQP